MTIEEQLERLYTGTLICPYKGCYEKDPVRYLNRQVLYDHTKYDHVVYMEFTDKPIKLIKDAK